MRLKSDAISPDRPIPVKYTKDGDNSSPPLSWGGLPEGTRELALTFENVTEPFVQWILYKIPPERDGLPEGIGHRAEAEKVPGALQGRNSLGNVGYDGPIGTVNRTFRYRLRLYALDQPLAVGPGLDRDALERATAGHVLATADLETYFRRRRKAAD